MLISFKQGVVKTNKYTLTWLTRFRLAPLCINIKIVSLCPFNAASMTGLDPS